MTQSDSTASGYMPVIFAMFARLRCMLTRALETTADRMSGRQVGRIMAGHGSPSLWLLPCGFSNSFPMPPLMAP